MSRTLLSLAGFQVIISGRFWVIAEGEQANNGGPEKKAGCEFHLPRWRGRRCSTPLVQPTLYGFAADLLREVKQKIDARKYLQRAPQINPSYPVAEQIRSTLNQISS